MHVVHTGANRQPAVALYVEDPRAPIARPYGLVVLELQGDAIAAMTYFGDTAVFASFGLPRSLPTGD